jgi:acetoin utilization deacetylase AcuC-like enzyme
MKIVFHPKYLPSYDDTPAGDDFRLEPTLDLLKKDAANVFIEPQPANEEMILKAHSREHFLDIKDGGGGGGQNVFEISLLGAGGAILTAEIAAKGDTAFGMIRPPGHHASYDSCWGFCYFCNMAVALLHLRATTNIKRAFLLDFDLHTGDGNINILSKYKDYTIVNPTSSSEQNYLKLCEESIQAAKPCDIVCASAGFDQGINDWGRLLTPAAYQKIGEMLKEMAVTHCEGRRFALLEGGYNFPEMAKSIDAFLKGFR